MYGADFMRRYNTFRQAFLSRASRQEAPCYKQELFFPFTGQASSECLPCNEEDYKTLMGMFPEKLIENIDTTHIDWREPFESRGHTPTKYMPDPQSERLTSHKITMSSPAQIAAHFIRGGKFGYRVQTGVDGDVMKVDYYFHKWGDLPSGFIYTLRGQKQ